MVRFPRFLRPGDRIGVTAPSSGVPEALQGRLDVAVDWVRERGHEVEVGRCMDGSGHVSASAMERADELMRMLLDPEIRAIVPPWGGETAIDLLPHLDFDALRDAEPTWVVGYSDISTLLTPLTLISGWATVHGDNLMDTPYEPAGTLLHWFDLVSGVDQEGGAVDTFRQEPPGVHRANDVDRWEDDPTPTAHRWNGIGGWRRLDGGTERVDVEGRLIGGGIETLTHLAGTRYANTARLRGPDGDGPLVAYVEACEDNAFSICRSLHGMRLGGFFDGADAVLVGRTTAPDSATLTQDEAVLDALGGLGVPIIADVDCGHVPPHMTLVNGALARVVHDDKVSFVEQRLA